MKHVPSTFPRKRLGRASTPLDALPAAFLLIATATLAGCLEADGSAPGPDDAPRYSLRGVFTENATQEDLKEFGEFLAPYGVEAMIMESFPPQFSAHGFTEADCAEARAKIVDLPYVADVGECRETTTSDDPSKPTSNVP